MLENLETFHYKGFRFETHWLKGDGFLEVVDAAWNKEVHLLRPVRTLHIKLA
jgi:hypothetical protein